MSKKNGKPANHKLALEVMCVFSLIWLIWYLLTTFVSAGITGGLVDHLVETKGVSCRWVPSALICLIHSPFYSWIISTKRRPSTRQRRRPKRRWLILENFKSDLEWNWSVQVTSRASMYNTIDSFVLVFPFLLLLPERLYKLDVCCIFLLHILPTPACILSHSFK